jgi:pyruvate dehydrogenase E2 component (dihydrolipoyllysine-residue acetyltransferase)
VPTDIVMPRLSDSMEEGTILRWIKSQGDEVAVGDELVEIETDKANMVYESDAAGTLIEILAGEGDTLQIGETIARVGEPDEAGGDGAGPKSEPEPKAEEEPRQAPEPERPSSPASTKARQEQAPGAVGVGSEPEGDGRAKASPLARRMARERGLDLAALTGSGPGGRVVKADVERAAATTAPQEQAPGAVTARTAEPTPGTRERPETAKGDVETIELTKVQQTIARRMAESKATAPHFYLEAEVDMSRAVEGRGRIKAAAKDGDVVPSFNDMVVKAAALALREFPRANGAYRDGRVEQYSRINVGVAVAAQDALIVPTVFDADAKGLREIAAETRALAQRVREGQITPPELSGGTFTVSNLGMYGITNFSAVINPPQAAILAVGSIVERPVVRDGEIATAHLMPLNLACDHRILYGADGAQLLARIRELLEEPLSLAL